MPQARGFSDAELDAVAGGDGLAAAAVNLAAASLPGVPVSVTITAVSAVATAGSPSLAMVAIGGSLGTAVVVSTASA